MIIRDSRDPELAAFLVVVVMQAHGDNNATRRMGLLVWY